MRTYKIVEGSLHDRFQLSRAKVQFFGGGFGNGKTAGAVIKTLGIARDYPGANILMARSTYPRLNDTLRKEFLKWCPTHWIKSFPRSNNGSNTCTLTNGTEINFRYVDQKGASSADGGTSNLLSATYDLVVVDQIEDPEISEKDFDDLMGRLRGATPYRGDDQTMPNTGPRWLIVMSNPTRNWVYKSIVRPYHHYFDTGEVSEKLLIRREPITKKPILGTDGKPQLLLEMFEGSTYENRHVLESDFIELLESRYTGQMARRFLMGEWAAYEGLVYPQFDELVHCISSDVIKEYLFDLRAEGYQINWVEGYDYGMAVPMCYLLGFVDPYYNIIIVGGMYQPEMPPDKQIKGIKEIREDWDCIPKKPIYADPSIFRRGTYGKKIVGRSTADIMFDRGDGVRMQRGNANIANGIQKVGMLLNPMSAHRNPFTGSYDSSHMYFNSDLEFIANEFSNYVWRVNPDGERVDEPRDKDDHAMDTIKYISSVVPSPSVRERAPIKPKPAYPTTWFEPPDKRYN